MKIEGPLTIEVIDDTAKNSRRVDVKFRPDFQAISAEQQTVRMQSYIQQLNLVAQSLDQESADYQGVQLILPLCEQVLPYLADQSIDLTETISLEMDLGTASSQVYVNLTNLKLN